MTAADRASRNAPTIDLKAVKYIRIIIATYILAVGLELVDGFDAYPCFSGFLPHSISLYVSEVFVTFCALMLFFGFCLRIVSLCLTIVVLASSVQANLMFPAHGSIDAFWTDMLLICGLLACYYPLSARQLRKQALVKLGPIVRAVPRRVIPRRVRVSLLQSTRPAKRVKPVIPEVAEETTPTPQQHDLMLGRASSMLPHKDVDDDEVINIFA